MKKLGSLLFLIGVGFMFYAIFIEEKQKEDISQLQSALEAIQNTDKTESIEQEVESSLNISKDDLREVIMLKIPSIDLEAPVLPETTQKNLNVALTQIKKNQVPGKGNFTVAGHNSAVYGRHFNRLDEVDKNDKIYLTDEDNQFVYQVVSKKVIDPTDVDVLNDTPGQSEITLITCTISGVKRVAVKGQLMTNH